MPHCNFVLKMVEFFQSFICDDSLTILVTAITHANNTIAYNFDDLRSCLFLQALGFNSGDELHASLVSHLSPSVRYSVITLTLFT